MTRVCGVVELSSALISSASASSPLPVLSVTVSTASQDSAGVTTSFDVSSSFCTDSKSFLLRMDASCASLRSTHDGNLMAAAGFSHQRPLCARSLLEVACCICRSFRACLRLSCVSRTHAVSITGASLSDELAGANPQRFFVVFSRSTVVGS